MQDRVPDGWLVVKRTDDIEANPAGDTDEAEEVNKQKDAPEVDGRSEDEIELLPQGSHSRNVSNSSTSDAGIRRKEKIERTYIQRRSGSNNSNPERLPRNSTI